MKRLYFKASFYFLLLLLGIGLISCNDFFEVSPEDALTPENNYRTVDDVNNSVLGIYSQLYNIADQYIILNELRGDLIDVTENSDADLNRLSRHDVSPGNKYADPAPFYKIINSCNDVLKNINKMKDELRLNETDFRERYADIMAIRCWLYFQLGIHFGQIPYITTPFETVSDIGDYSSFPSYPFSVLLDTLLKTMEGLPTLEQYITFPDVVLNGNNFAAGSWFDKKFFMAELYMWTEQYLKAAEIYRTLMEPAPAGYDQFNWHRMVGVGNYSPRITFYDIYTADNSSRFYRNENVWALFFDERYG